MTGSVFKVRVLLLLLSIVLVESALSVMVHGSVAGLWALANLIGVQVGYLAGIVARRIMELAGYASHVSEHGA